MRDLVPFAQFEKREKRPWRSVTFSKINFSPWVFFTFFKLYKWYQISHLVILAFGNYSNLIRISLNIPKSSVIWTSSVCVLVLYLISWKNEYISTFNIFFCHFFSFFVVWKTSLNYIWPFDRRQFGTSVFTKLLF